MISSLHALILREGNVVRSDIARPETVARYLHRVGNLADYHVAYWLEGLAFRVTGEGFLTLYAAGVLTLPSLSRTRDDLATLLATHWGEMPRTRARLRRAVEYVRAALVRGTDVETYAQIKAGFWYKVYFFTPVGALKSDTGGEHLDQASFARKVIRSQDLRRVPLTAVMENWLMGGLWERNKPLSTFLLHTWKTCGHVTDVSVRQASLTRGAHG